MSTTSTNFVKPDALKIAEQAAQDERTTQRLTEEAAEYAKQISGYKKEGRELAALHVALSAFAAEWVGKEGYSNLTDALENISYNGQRVRERISSTQSYHKRSQDRLSAHLAALAGTKPAEANEFE